MTLGPDEYEIEVRRPSDCSPQQLQTFCAMVRLGDEVDSHNLLTRVKSARALAFLSRDDVTVGVAAIKLPSPPYRTSVFAKADSGPVADYPLELGWMFVAEEFRNRGLSSRLTRSVLSSAAGIGVFATCRAENGAMQSTLLRHGFRFEGKDFESERGQYRLKLYVKSLATTSQL